MTWALGASLIGIALLLFVLLVLYRMSQQAQSRRRLAFDLSGKSNAGLASEDPATGFLRRWLVAAGFRSPAAPMSFILATVLGLFVGVSLAVPFLFTSLQQVMEESVTAVPGGVGEVFLPAVWIAPWFALVLPTLVPWLIVRQARRRRMAAVDRDLPLVLELLSTLSEAGLGFDAALSRVLETRLAERSFGRELRTFQADVLAGRTRIESLKRLAARLVQPSVSVLVSALVQADQLGMGISRVLRQQAEDVRQRRKERALSFANSLAVKRVVPMVICFLPGLFVWTLGPAFVQLFKMVDAFVQVRQF